MTQRSLGLIETIGLAAAIEAADAAVKSANVTLVGYELARGDGMTVVKVEGEIGAVNAAIAAAAVAAAKINRVVSTRVIARPAVGIAGMIANGDTVGAEAAPACLSSAAAPVVASAPAPIAPAASVDETAGMAAPADPTAAAASPSAAAAAPRQATDAAQNPTPSEQSAATQLPQAKAGGRSSNGHNGKPKHRHGA
ncbi:BMC domain-containing protein [Rhodopseudomonas palustris]|uniref:Microcompartments protein n=1 Tax=Rhodopseudomonas palustris (strain BisB18) TaxID=316056 RepID=Q21A56_RHOPB